MAVIYFSEGDRFEIDSFSGLIREKPLLVVGFTVCLFSLAGLPPFAGFIGKFYLFKVVIEKQLYLLAVVAGVNSVVSLYYYIGVVKKMIIDSSDGPTREFTANSSPIVFVTLCSIPIILLGVYWIPLLDWASKVKLLF
jgi:NADH-quinone oxidoreductase subunit N